MPFLNLYPKEIGFNMLKNFRYPLGILFSNTLIGPYEVQLDIIHKCNLASCVTCWFYSPYRKKKISKKWVEQTLDFESFKSLVDSIKKIRTTQISIIGEGEPFLHKNIMEMLSYIKESKMKCKVITNGTLLTDKKIHELANIGVDEINISINAGTASTFYKVNPKSPKRIFEKLRENIILFSQYENRPIITFSNVISNINYLEIEKMLDFGIECKADRIYFKILDTFSEIEKLTLNDEQKMEMIDSIMKIDKFKMKNMKNNLNEFMQFCLNHEKAVEETPCYMGYVFSRIKDSKYVVPCCGCYTNPIGKISNNKSFEKIWKSKKYSAFRKNVFNQKRREKAGCECHQCPHFTENKKLDKLFKFIKILK